MARGGSGSHHHHHQQRHSATHSGQVQQNIASSTLLFPVMPSSSSSLPAVGDVHAAVTNVHNYHVNNNNNATTSAAAVNNVADLVSMTGTLTNAGTESSSNFIRNYNGSSNGNNPRHQHLQQQQVNQSNHRDHHPHYYRNNHNNDSSSNSNRNRNHPNNVDNNGRSNQHVQWNYSTDNTNQMNDSYHHGGAVSPTTTTTTAPSHVDTTMINTGSISGSTNTSSNSSRYHNDPSQLLSRGYSARYVGSILLPLISSGNNSSSSGSTGQFHHSHNNNEINSSAGPSSSMLLITPLTVEEIDRDLRHMTAYETAAARYHQIQYVTTNRIVSHSNNNNSNDSTATTSVNGITATTNHNTNNMNRMALTNGQQVPSNESDGVPEPATNSGVLRLPTSGPSPPPPVVPSSTSHAIILPNYPPMTTATTSTNSNSNSNGGPIMTPPYYGNGTGITGGGYHHHPSLPIRIDPDEEKRFMILGKRITRAEMIREEYEQQYSSLCYHTNYVINTLKSFTKHSALTTQFLQNVIKKQSLFLAIQRTRLQVVRDAMATIRTREDAILEWRQQQYAYNINRSSNNDNNLSAEELDRLGAIDNNCPLLEFWNLLEFYYHQAMTIQVYQLPTNQVTAVPHPSSSSDIGINQISMGDSTEQQLQRQMKDGIMVNPGAAHLGSNNNNTPNAHSIAFSMVLSDPSASFKKDAVISTTAAPTASHHDDGIKNSSSSYDGLESDSKKLYDVNHTVVATTAPTNPATLGLPNPVATAIASGKKKGGKKKGNNSIHQEHLMGGDGKVTASSAFISYITIPVVSSSNSSNHPINNQDTASHTKDHQSNDSSTTASSEQEDHHGTGKQQRIVKKQQQTKPTDDVPASSYEYDKDSLLWPCTVQAVTARGMPILVSAMSTAPDKTIAQSAGNMFGCNVQSLLYVPKYLPTDFISSANTSTTLVAASQPSNPSATELVAASRSAGAEMLQPPRSSPTNINPLAASAVTVIAGAATTSAHQTIHDNSSDDQHVTPKEQIDVSTFNEFPSKITQLNHEVMELQQQLKRERERNCMILSDTCRARVVNDEWVAMISLVRQETESILHRHNIILESEKGIEASAKYMLLLQQQQLEQRSRNDNDMNEEAMLDHEAEDSEMADGEEDELIEGEFDDEHHNEEDDDEEEDDDDEEEEDDEDDEEEEGEIEEDDGELEDGELEENAGSSNVVDNIEDDDDEEEEEGEIAEDAVVIGNDDIVEDDDDEDDDHDDRHKNNNESNNDQKKETHVAGSIDRDDNDEEEEGEIEEDDAEVQRPRPPTTTALPRFGSISFRRLLPLSQKLARTGSDHHDKVVITTKAEDVSSYITHDIKEDDVPTTATTKVMKSISNNNDSNNEHDDGNNMEQDAAAMLGMLRRVSTTASQKPNNTPNTGSDNNINNKNDKNDNVGKNDDDKNQDDNNNTVEQQEDGSGNDEDDDDIKHDNDALGANKDASDTTSTTAKRISGDINSLNVDKNTNTPSSSTASTPTSPSSSQHRTKRRKF